MRSASFEEQKHADVRIRDFDRRFIPALARAHRASFPGHLLTELGGSYIERYYGALLDSGVGIGVIASRDDDVVGLAIGSLDLDEFQRHLYRHNLVTTAGTVAIRYLTSAKVRGMVNQRANYIRHGLRLLVAGRRSKPEGGLSSVDGSTEQSTSLGCGPGVVLMSMAVVPEHRGSRLATELITRFEQASKQRGHFVVKLSVDRSNARAIRFYEKAGYELCNDRRNGGLDYRKRL